LIELKNISLTYKNNIIIKNLNLHIKKGERLVILGASGSGKTTLLRLIAGFIAPTFGKIEIDNKIVSKDKEILVPPHLRGIGMVFQDLALWPHMNVKENISFGLKINKTSKKEIDKKVKEMLSLVGLDRFENKKIEELSGGEQQRVALARALIVLPKILLMDEPLSSLNRELNIQLSKEIVTLQEKFGFTLVYVTHNEDEAKKIASRIFYMTDLS
jgi:ABC-type Fe3+/spermidine/putrescine transport system ATPase subunit